MERHCNTRPNRTQSRVVGVDSFAYVPAADSAGAYLQYAGWYVAAAASVQWLKGWDCGPCRCMQKSRSFAFRVSSVGRAVVLKLADSLVHRFGCPDKLDQEASLADQNDSTADSTFAAVHHQETLNEAAQENKCTDHVENRIESVKEEQMDHPIVCCVAQKMIGSFGIADAGRVQKFASDKKVLWPYMEAQKSVPLPRKDCPSVGRRLACPLSGLS